MSHSSFSTRPSERPTQRGAARLDWRPVTLYLALLTLSFGLCGLAYVFLSELRATLVLEDGPIENLSLLFYLLGASVAALGLFSRVYRFRGMLILAALCLIGVLEEISYGQRLFPSLNFPTLPSGMTFDALHDAARIVVKQFERLGVPWYFGFLISAFALLIPVAWFLRGRLEQLRAALTPRSAWLYVALGAGLAVLALFIDSQGFVPRKWAFLEEVLEMNAALSLAFAAGVGVFFARRASSRADQPEIEAAEKSKSH